MGSITKTAIWFVFVVSIIWRICNVLKGCNILVCAKKWAFRRNSFPLFGTRLFVCAKKWILRAQQVPKQPPRALFRVFQSLWVAVTWHNKCNQETACCMYLKIRCQMKARRYFKFVSRWNPLIWYIMECEGMPRKTVARRHVEVYWTVIECRLFWRYVSTVRLERLMHPEQGHTGSFLITIGVLWPPGLGLSVSPSGGCPVAIGVGIPEHAFFGVRSALLCTFWDSSRTKQWVTKSSRAEILSVWVETIILAWGRD